MSARDVAAVAWAATVRHRREIALAALDAVSVAVDAALEDLRARIVPED